MVWAVIFNLHINT